MRFDPGHGRDTPGFPRRFTMREGIRFHHCDPAGIAFFARLDELLNAAFEDWCAAVDLPFSALMAEQRCGFPLVHASIDYTDILRMGDDVVVSHHVREARRSSIVFDVRIDAGDRPCLSGTHIRVMTSLDTNRAVPLPAGLLALLQETT
jgi:4-hydroxybenzoyl-CoA thioesterase